MFRPGSVSVSDCRLALPKSLRDFLTMITLLLSLHLKQLSLLVHQFSFMFYCFFFELTPNRKILQVRHPANKPIHKTDLYYVSTYFQKFLLIFAVLVVSYAAAFHSPGTTLDVSSGAEFYIFCRISR